MPMYNLIEYSNNSSESSKSLQQFKRDEIANANVTNNDNASSFKHKEGVKIAVALKYLSNVWRSLETPLINCKVEIVIEIDWNCIENCILFIAGYSATFKISDPKLYVPVVTLSTEDNGKLSKLLSDGFKRPVYWNK